MGSILTFECGCLLAIDAYPQGYVTKAPEMRYNIDTASWCSKHKDEVKRGIVNHMKKEMEEIDRFIDNWYYDRNPNSVQSEVMPTEPPKPVE